jgi:putative two-component system hydrogenase maturation factor HypX/HoxX
MGGRDLWSNGIDLNAIEAAHQPGARILDQHQRHGRLGARDHHHRLALGHSALAGNAGAGGVTLALGTDNVYARTGIVLNPHYQGMSLYGSEYWTYLLPRRVGHQQALQLTDNCLPISTRRAKAIGLIDDAFGSDLAEFRDEIRQSAESLARSVDLERRLHLKRQARQTDERTKPLRAYRDEELAKMAINFGDPQYHQSRQAFVYKRQLVGAPF